MEEILETKIDKNENVQNRIQKPNEVNNENPVKEMRDKNGRNNNKT